jgi:signal transduction histidine kinase
MKSLHSRLLVSYTLVILVCLAVIAVAMWLLLARQPLPEQQIYRDLENKTRWLSSRPQMTEWLQAQPPQRLAQGLQQLDETLRARIMLVDADGRVVADTGSSLVGHDLLEEADLNRQTSDMVRGTVRPAGTRQDWLFVGRALTSPRLSTARWFVVAQQAPRLPVFQLLGANLLAPLVQAGLLALILSVLLAWLVSRSVARPIEQAAAAARAIADGCYDQRLPLTGPTKVRELADTFNQMAQQVKASQQAQRDFVANVSHDLKTPLTSIQGFSQAILDGTAADPGETVRVAGIIHDEAGRMRRMVDDLLLLARMDAGQLPLERRPIDPALLLENCIARMAPRARQAGIVLDLNLSPAGLPQITGDGDQLVQLFSNLMENALKHTRAGGRVAVTGGSDDREVVITIADTGPGIPEDQLPRVFERFYQVEKSRARSRTKGAGLGLAICKELAEAHGGRITAESVVGVGTKFSVHLPRADSAPTLAHRRR